MVGSSTVAGEKAHFERHGLIWQQISTMLRWVGKYIQTYGKSKCLAAPRWPKYAKLSPTIRSLIFAHDFAILKTLKMGSWANRFDAGEAEAWRWQLQFRLAEMSWEYWNDTHPMSSNRAMGNCWNPLQMVFEWEISYKWRFSIAMFGYQMVDYRTVVLVRIFRWLWCLSCPPLFDSGPLATHTHNLWKQWHVKKWRFDLTNFLMARTF